MSVDLYVVPVDKEIYVKCEVEFDDEVHLLTVCKKYISIREDMSEKVCISNALVTQLRGRELFRELRTTNDFGTLVCVANLFIAVGKVKCRGHLNDFLK